MGSFATRTVQILRTFSLLAENEVCLKSRLCCVCSPLVGVSSLFFLGRMSRPSKFDTHCMCQVFGLLLVFALVLSRLRSKEEYRSLLQLATPGQCRVFATGWSLPWVVLH